MAGFTPDEGETLIAKVIHFRTSTDRDANMLLGLFTTTNADETTTAAAIAECTGTGYAVKTLTDASWDVTGAVASYATQTFTGGASGWAPAVHGYFIKTIAAGGTPRLVYVEIDANGPYTINENDTYKITPAITIS